METEYVPLKYNETENLTLLEVKLITGKPHQIRAHLSSIGHPIIGDIKYGGKKYKNINYQVLHSYRISFPSNMQGELSYLSGKKFVAKMPEIFDII